MAQEPALVTPAMLAWARTSMNYDLSTAAKRAQVKPERLDEWERGVGRPSIPQARRLAAVYKRPFAALFLPAPPRDFSIPRDFRRLPDALAAASPQLIEAIRLAEYRRSTAVDLAGPDEGRSDLVGMATTDDDPETLAGQVRGMLGVSSTTQRRWGSEYDALNGWKSAIEAHNVLVFHFSRVSVDEARAFSVAEDRFPVVAVNGGDRPRPRIFSLMHELCHVALRMGGISDLHEGDTLAPDTQIEVFCNRFSGASLIPREALVNEPLVRRADQATMWSDDELSELARYYWVSREVVLRRLLTIGKTSAAFYRQKRDELHTRLRQNEDDEGGFLVPSRSAIRAVGQPFARLVLGAYYDNAITLSDVSELLGVRVKHIPTISALLEGRNILTGGDR